METQIQWPGKSKVKIQRSRNHKGKEKQARTVNQGTNVWIDGVLGEKQREELEKEQKCFKTPLKENKI